MNWGENNGGIGYVLIKIWLTEDCTVGHFYIFWSHLKKKIYIPALQRNFLPPKKRLKRDYLLQLLK